MLEVDARAGDGPVHPLSLPAHALAARARGFARSVASGMGRAHCGLSTESVVSVLTERVHEFTALGENARGL